MSDPSVDADPSRVRPFLAAGYSMPVFAPGIRARMEAEQAVVKLNVVLNGQIELTEIAWHEVNRRCAARGFSYKTAIESVCDDIVSGRIA